MIATAATARPSTSTRRPGRAGNVALWTLQVAMAAVFVMVAFPKVTLDPTAVDGFARMVGFSAAGTVIIGLLELAGTIGLLVPRLNGVAALGLVGLMIGATIVTVASAGVATAALPAALGVAAVVIAWFRRYRTVELVALLRTPSGR